MKYTLSYVCAAITVSLAAPNAFGEWLGDITPDQTTGIMYTKAVIGRSYTRDPFELIVQCKTNEPISVGILWYEYFPDPETDVVFAFDDTTPLVLSAPFNLNNSYVSLIKDGNELIELLKKSKNLNVSTGFWRGKKIRNGTFSLQGFTESFEKYCGWHGHAMSAGDTKGSD